jgi:hypothetical protein
VILRRLIIVVAALIPALPVGLHLHYRPDRAIRTGAGAVADIVCAKTFVSGLDPEVVFAETMDRPGFQRLRFGMRYRIDRAAKTVEASVLGFFTSRSAFHEGFGCVPSHGSKEPYLLKSDV